MTVVMCAEQRLCLGDQIAMRLKLSLIQFEIRTIISHQVQVHGHGSARRQSMRLKYWPQINGESISCSRETGANG